MLKSKVTFLISHSKDTLLPLNCQMIVARTAHNCWTRTWALVPTRTSPGSPSSGSCWIFQAPPGRRKVGWPSAAGHSLTPPLCSCGSNLCVPSSRGLPPKMIYSPQLLGQPARTIGPPISKEQEGSSEVSPRQRGSCRTVCFLCDSGWHSRSRYHLKNNTAYWKNTFFLLIFCQDTSRLFVWAESQGHFSTIKVHLMGQMPCLGVKCLLTCYLGNQLPQRKFT